MSHLKEFDNTDEMYEFLLKCLESGKLSPEEMMTPDWAVADAGIVRGCVSGV